MDEQNLERSELIDRYLSGHLNETEMRHFRKKLEDDEALRKDLENSEISIEAIKNFGLRHELKRIRQEMLAEETTQTTPDVEAIPERREVPTISMFRYLPRVAASVLIVLVATVTTQVATLSGEKLYASKESEHPLPYGDFNTVRGNKETSDAEVRTMERSFASGDYQAAIQQYETMKQPSVDIDFIAGNAYLQTNQPAKAIDIFEHLLEIDQTQGQDFFKNDTEYYLALSYLRAGDYDQALEKFQELKASDSNYSEYVDGYFLWKLKMLDWFH